MPHVPFDGRLDLHVACLLVTERHHELANRSVTSADVAALVLELIDHLDVDADDLGDLDEFQDAVDEAMDDLVKASWLSRRRYGSVIRFSGPPPAEDAIEWIRSRLASRPRRLNAFDELANEITELVVTRHATSSGSPIA